LQEWIQDIAYRYRQWQPRLRPDAYSERSCEAVEQSWIPAPVSNQLHPMNLRASLFYRSLLELTSWQSPKSSSLVLDLGCKNWFYASGVVSWLESRAGGLIDFVGVECDPGRRYLNFFRRGDVARYHAQLATKNFMRTQARFEFSDWHSRPAVEADLILCFYPFLFEDLHLSWGLPKRMFHPRDFYEKCAREGKQMIFVHQDEEERDESLRLLEVMGAQVLLEQKVFENPWLQRRYPSWIVHWSPQNLKPH
jgi:hypothetical protein